MPFFLFIEIHPKFWYPLVAKVSAVTYLVFSGCFEICLLMSIGKLPSAIVYLFVNKQILTFNSNSYFLIIDFLLKLLRLPCND